MNNNERLAEIIESKLLEKGLIVENNSDFKNKLSSGNLKDVDWKFLLEEIDKLIKELNFMGIGDKSKEYNKNLVEEQKGFKHNWQGLRVVTELEQIDEKNKVKPNTFLLTLKCHWPRSKII